MYRQLSIVISHIIIADRLLESVRKLVIYIIKGVMFVCLFVCLSVSMFRMAGQTAGPIETKLDTRTHVHPGSVSGKVNVKVIHVCVRE